LAKSLFAQRHLWKVSIGGGRVFSLFMSGICRIARFIVALSYSDSAYRECGEDIGDGFEHGYP
jgi:hypothetical protein